MEYIHTLRNSNKSSTERNNALDALARIDIYQDALSDVCNLLQDLIQYDKELGIGAFRTLVARMPYGLDLRLHCFDNFMSDSRACNVCLEDIALLHRKSNSATLLPIAQLLIRIMQTNEAKELEAVALLKKVIVDIYDTNGLISDECIHMLVSHLPCSKQSTVRRTILDILEKNIGEARVSQYIDPIYLLLQRNIAELRLDDYSVKQALLILGEAVDIGFTIPEDKILMLISILQNRRSYGFWRNTAKLLLEIEQTQGLSDEACAKLGGRPLHCNNLMYTIIAERDVNVNATDIFMSILWIMCFLSPYSMPYTSLVQLLVSAAAIVVGLMISCGRSEPGDDISLSTTVKAMAIASEDKDVRIVALQYVSMHVRSSGIMHPHIEQSLMNVAVQKDVNDWRINACAFEVLRNNRDWKSVSVTSFTVSYYDILRVRLQQPMGAFHSTTLNATSLAQLDSYMADELKCVMEKFDLLACLNNGVLLGCLHSGIFSEFDEKYWRREILCSCLLHYVMKPKSASAPRMMADDFELKAFTDSLSSLQLFLRTCGDPAQYSLEVMLNALFDKRAAISDLVSLNNVLLFMLSGLDALNIVVNNSESVNMQLELQNVWLAKKLSEACIMFTHESLTTLSKCLSFKATFVDRALNVVKRSTKVETLIDFFQTLSNCSLRHEMKDDFLANISVAETSPTLVGWKHKLARVIIKCQVMDKHRQLFAGIQISKFDELHEHLMRLLLNGWAIGSIEEFIKLINGNKSLDNVLYTTQLISEYRLMEFNGNAGGQSLMSILAEDVDLEGKVHDLAVFQSFSQTHNNESDQLRDELMALNSNGNINLMAYMNQYDAVINAYNKADHDLPGCMTCIKDWNMSDINSWVNNKEVRENTNQCIRIAVVRRAVEIVNNFPPREVQLLTVIMMLKCTADTGRLGRLAQIATGEGKTVIIAMIAVLMALDGHKVDIVTSSPELAVPHSEQQRRFYGMFGLKVSNICDTLSPSFSASYDADIVYGDATSFQRDLLWDECCKHNTRKGRCYDIAIVDEVDSMLVDSRNHIVMLASPIPAMDNLEPLLVAIWLQLAETEKCIHEEDGKIYFVQFDKGLDENTGKMHPEAIKELHHIECTKAEFLKKSTLMHLRRMLRDLEHLDEPIHNDYPEIKIPKHLRKFVTAYQLEHWVDSAIYAKYRLQKDRDYVIECEKIIPVDAQNTGVMQRNMHYSDGLHQFLQIKHGAKISPENLITNFVSNIVYFRRYGSLCGLSGTLGSSPTTKLLQDTYKVDIVYIPSFRPKQHVHLPAVLSQSRSEWYNRIVESCLSKLRNGRAVLIITKYIEEAKRILQLFTKLNYDKTKLRLYMSDKESSSVKESLDEGEVIIATNIAGRGTDIKVADSVERNGGLHVCVSFLPTNTRIEQQNVGRTSRMGNKGTSQFVLLHPEAQCIQDIIRERDLEDEKAIDRASQEIEKVVCQDEIFQKFRYLVDNVCVRSELNNYHVEELEERFAIWLIQHRTNLTDRKLLRESFGIFENEISQDCQKLELLIKNPHYYVLMGNESVRRKKYDDAITQYTKAITMDEEFAEFAYYNRGLARLAKSSGTKIHIINAQNAVLDLRRAKELIEMRETYLHFIQSVSHAEVLSEQVSHKMTVYAVLKNAIDVAVGVRSECFDKDISDLKSALETAKTQGHAETVRHIEEQLENVRKYQASKASGVIGHILENNHAMEFKFLSVEESLPCDQDASLYEDEIEEAKINGLLWTFQVQEIQPIKWWHVAGLAVIGITQLLAGSALAVFTLGAGSIIGLNLVCEGVSDLIASVVGGLIQRNFSWASWAIQKAVSLTVSVVSAGVSAAKDVCKTVCSMGKYAVTETTKAGWKIAGNVIGTHLAKGIGKELLTHIVNCGVDNIIMPYIEAQITDTIQAGIDRFLLRDTTVQTLLKKDAEARNKHYFNVIMELADNILFKCKHEDGALAQIGKGIAKGVATNKIVGLSLLLQSVEVTKALYDLVTCVDNFLSELHEAIESKVKNNSLIIDTVTECHVDAVMPHIDTEYDDVDLSKRAEDHVKLSRSAVNQHQLSTELSNHVALKMSKIVQSKLIAPAASFAINTGMASVMEGLDKHVENEIGNFQAFRRIIVTEKGDAHLIPAELTKGSEDPKTVEEANQLISDVEDGGPLGLYNLRAVSECAEKQIKVLNENGNTLHIIGNPDQEVIEVEYHGPTEQNPNGHWTLPGNKEPSRTDPGTNDCLLNVVAQQAGISRLAKELRRDVVNHMKRNVATLANRVDDIKRLKSLKNSLLIMGGLPERLPTATRADSRVITENSQRERPAFGRNYGHAISTHVGPPNANTNPRTTLFITDSDLYDVVDHVLRDQQIYDVLNNGAQRIRYTLSAAEMNRQYNMYDATGSVTRAGSFKAIIGHRKHEYGNPHSDPHVLTVYPVSDNADTRIERISMQPRNGLQRQRPNIQ